MYDSAPALRSRSVDSSRKDRLISGKDVSKTSMTSTFIGVDLAWSEKNPSGLAVARGDERTAEIVLLSAETRSYRELAEAIGSLAGRSNETTVVAIDAPLVVTNAEGCRPCERALSKVFGSAGASTHSSNLGTFAGGLGPPRFEALLAELSFHHAADPDLARTPGRWMVEVYPHPAFVNLFALAQRVAYKKGSVENRRRGLQTVRELLAALRERDPSLEPGEFGRTLHGRDLLRVAGAGLKAVEDQLDAWLCAYIAQHIFRWGRQRNLMFGEEDHGYILVPARYEGDVVRLNAGPSTTPIQLDAAGERSLSRQGAHISRQHGAEAPINSIPGENAMSTKARKGSSLTPGKENRNKQIVVRATGLPGTYHGQSVYEMRCASCDTHYGANGSDAWQRKCPRCQSGRPGLRFR